MDVVKMKVDRNGEPLCRVANVAVPEHATAHEEARVRAHIAKTGFSVGESTFGNWCGRPGGSLHHVALLPRRPANVRN
jgi:hypothetical protein